MEQIFSYLTLNPALIFFYFIFFALIEFDLNLFLALSFNYANDIIITEVFNHFNCFNQWQVVLIKQKINLKLKLISFPVGHSFVNVTDNGNENVNNSSMLMVNVNSTEILNQSMLNLNGSDDKTEQLPPSSLKLGDSNEPSFIDSIVNWYEKDFKDWIRTNTNLFIIISVNICLIICIIFLCICLLTK